MKLSEIVAYINLLDSVSTDIECEEAVRKLDSLLHIVVNHSMQLGRISHELNEDFKSVTRSLSNFTDTVANLRGRLQQELEAQEPEYLRESQRWFDHEQPFETNEYILNRRLAIDPESNILLRSRLRSLADWRLPCLIFRPGLDTFVEDLVPMDPLYLVDQDQELLDPSVKQFTPEYQRRLREYTIDDRKLGKYLDIIPDNQFGLIFAYNYFNYKPLQVIKQYLGEIYAKLRPGGSVILTYNNCDRAQGVGLAEHNFMCYTPKNHILNYTDRIGFELLSAYDGEGDVSWLELKRPGEITSFRGGQTLARIVVKSK